MAEKKRIRPTVRQVKSLNAKIESIEYQYKASQASVEDITQKYKNANELLSQTIGERNDAIASSNYWKEKYETEKEIADQNPELLLKISTYNSKSWWDKILTWEI